MILALRTDTGVAEMSLYDPATGNKIAGAQAELGRSMAKELPGRLEVLLQQQQANWPDMTGVVVFRGPGSFTGLRIGITLANTLAYGRSIPIVGSKGEDWLKNGTERLAAGEDDRIVVPAYGGEAHITTPRK